MISKSKKASVLFMCGLLGVLAPFAQAQTISKFFLISNNDSPTRDLSLTINGKQKVVTSQAFKAWIVEGGRAVLWSAPDGAGGFENEGQALWRYDAQSGQKQRLAAEYFEIDKVHEAKSASGKTAFIVAMNDGGLGGPHLALVDPKRGIVWRQQMARVTAIRNGRFAVGLVTEEAVSESNGHHPSISRVFYVDVDKLLKRKVITLPHV